MNMFAKVLVVFVLILSAAFAVSQGVLRGRRVNYMKVAKEKNAQLITQTARADRLQKELNDTTTSLDRLRNTSAAQIAGLKEQVTTKDSRIEELSGDKATLQSSLTSERIETNKLRGIRDQKDQLIAELNTTKTDLSGKLRQASLEIARLQDDVRGKGNNIEGLNARIVQLTKEKTDMTRARNDLSEIIASLQERGVHIPLQAVPVVDGKVVRVDEATGAVVINKGRKDKVKVNMPFTISTNGEYVGKVIVQEVRDELCLGLVEEGMVVAPIQIGYDATSRVY